jgi:hypothetical protein
MGQESFHENPLRRIFYGRDQPEAVPGDVENEYLPDLVRGPEVFPDIFQPVHSALCAILYHAASSLIAAGCFAASFIKPRLLITFTESMLAYC